MPFPSFPLFLPYIIDRYLYRCDAPVSVTTPYIAVVAKCVRRSACGEATGIVVVDKCLPLCLWQGDVTGSDSLIRERYVIWHIEVLNVLLCNNYIYCVCV